MKLHTELCRHTFIYCSFVCINNLIIFNIYTLYINKQLFTLQ